MLICGNNVMNIYCQNVYIISYDAMYSMPKATVRARITFLSEIKYKIKNLRTLLLRLCKNFATHNKQSIATIYCSHSN